MLSLGGIGVCRMLAGFRLRYSRSRCRLNWVVRLERGLRHAVQSCGAVRCGLRSDWDNVPSLWVLRWDSGT